MNLDVALVEVQGPLQVAQSVDVVALLALN